MPTPDELEDAAAADASAGLRRRLEALTRKAVTLYESMSDEPGRKMARDLIARQLAEVHADDVSEAIVSRSQEATTLGVTEAARKLGQPIPNRRIQAPTEAFQAARRAREAAQEEIAEAVRWMEKAEDSSDVLTALTRARRSVTRVEAGARFAVNRSLSEGTRLTAEHYGAGRIWLPERDACVHCLAYAGEYAGPGENYAGGLTFGRKPLHTGPVAGPPLHPNCRCRDQVWLREWGEDMRSALKREALRSVLRGWSRPSESEAVRLDAAHRALRDAGRMPKSVQDYARRAVKAGKFPRGKAFPTFDSSAKARSDRRDVREARKPEPPRDPLAGLPRKAKPEQRISADAERRADVKAVNPLYALSDAYKVNCQRVAVAYELRRRGYDVTALPNHKGTDKQYSLPDLEALWAPHWITPTGQVVPEDTPHALQVKPRFTPVMPGGSTEDMEAGAKAIVAGWPPGARGWVVAAWRGGGAHIWNVEVSPGGRVRWTDGQPGTVGAEGPDGYWRQVGTLFLMRTDELTPAAEQATMVRPPY